MRFEKGHKAATRARIVEVASERFLKDGVAATGIATVMADAGLTHGGFYAHFSSKDELVGEAMQSAAARTKARLDRTASDATIEDRIKNYLRASHRDAAGRGCVAAALAAEIARLGDPTRKIFTEQLEAIFARLAAQLPSEIPDSERLPRAIGIFGTMMGTLQLARAADNPALSDKILESGVAAALRLARP
jgi:AcrR family transcriptional regulator